MEATVLDHVISVIRIYSGETFGTVVGVVRARGVGEAVRIANDTAYGLSAAVYGRDVTQALAVAKRTESGMCHINGPTA
jgi:acyl-CoA reductase-like NAD-dependent aldehyde dehydrogenase